MMRFIFFLIFSLAYFSIEAQQEFTKFGEVTIEDFSATPYDSLASSVILFAKGKYSFDGPHPILEYHIRVKINKRAGFDQWGDFRLGNDFKSVSKIKAATYYFEEGKIRSHFIEKNDIFNDRQSEQKIISLEKLTEGCVIELTYIYTYSDFVIPTWLIQDEVPVLWSEYQMKSPANVTSVIHGSIKPFIYDSKYNRVYNRWVFKNVDPFREEPRMPSSINYFARIEFWNYSNSWGKVNDNYLIRHGYRHERFEPQFLKKQVKKLVESVPDSLEKVKVLCHFIKKSFKWNGGSGISSKDLSTVNDNKEGDSGDLNIFLYSMLQFAGLNPNLVLLRTPHLGFVHKDLPSERQFNYVLCLVVVNGKEYFLDVTDPLLPFNVVPEYCLNADGFVVSKSGYEWKRIYPVMAEKTKINAWLSISLNQMLKGKITIIKQGYGAFDDRHYYNEVGEDNFKKENIPDKTWIIDSTRITNIDRTDLPIIETYYASQPGFIMEANERIYVNPYILLREKRNSWTDENRQFPIDFGLPEEKSMVINITVPPEFKVENLPDDLDFFIPDKSISCSIKFSGNDKNVVVAFSFSMQRTWFEKNEYESLRQFNDTMISKQDEPIIFVKK